MRGRAAGSGFGIAVAIGVAWGLFALAPARAAVLAWSGELSLGLAGLEGLAATGTGLATLNDGLALERLALAGGLRASTVVPLTDPVVTAAGVVSVRASASLGAATFRVDPFGPGGLPELTQDRLPLRGRLRQCLFYAGCNSGSLSVPFTSGGERGAGLGGTVARGYASPRISLLGAPWTIHTASVLVPTAAPTRNATAPPALTTAYAFGTLHGPLSFTGSAAATWGGTGGSVQLVTPVSVLGLAEVPVAGFGRLRLHFVPEPARGLVGVALALGAVALGRARSATLRSRSGRTPCEPSSPPRPDAPSPRC